MAYGKCKLHISNSKILQHEPEIFFFSIFLALSKIFMTCIRQISVVTALLFANLRPVKSLWFWKIIANFCLKKNVHSVVIFEWILHHISQKIRVQNSWKPIIILGINQIETQIVVVSKILKKKGVPKIEMQSYLVIFFFILCRPCQTWFFEPHHLSN